MKRFISVIQCLGCGLATRVPYFVPKEDREVKACSTCERKATMDIARLMGVRA
jgi:hypothetical protein